MRNSVRFLVVDDHPVFRQGLVVLLSSNPRYEICGQAGTIEEALDICRDKLPDIALVDISLSHQNGLDLIHRFKSLDPDMPILIISMHDELVYAERALKSGASGYVMKQEAAAVMLDAVKTVLAGKIYVSPVMNERLLATVFGQREERDDLVNLLSDREFEVLEYIGQGYGASEISRILNLSVKTVNTYRDHIKEKMNFDTAAAIRRYAVKWWQSRRP
ncbi:response regulator transcription factor [Sediminispirochaeta smaragdinae]|jgi:DNA-binding NarL/FixJ family response regulator|uniref:Two component transcriptional regulator, LuxR family n=1 Tax=Sediminispirochaeta smaragdinae (strain DSM 11293 / JCM 15392 / SEBR 4228) TaxID=573413 RepID=E1R2R3_SEDSS|nr:response regulator transcription factor [Sediminispirochaeta smaragdinae]ADK80345.1 two component transcriptional regulator, LuxR family [Sediminispirochaeta smaragdinae DSM 11293]